MTTKTLAAELLSMRKQAEQAEKNIVQISNNLHNERLNFRQVVEDYNAKRVELFKQKLKNQRMTWCTKCWDVVLESEAQLLLVEGKKYSSSSYGTYGFVPFSDLHLACPSCRQKAGDKHGEKGEYDSLAQDQSSFYAFHVEKREDGYYAKKSGDWVKLDHRYMIGEPSIELMEKYTEHLNLPPRIEIESKYPSHEEKLIIHERVALNKAS